MNDDDETGWETYRRPDRTIDLAWVWNDQVTKELPDHVCDMVEYFLKGIEKKQPIRSRQVAALAIMQANVLAMQMNPDFKLLS